MVSQAIGVIGEGGVLVVAITAMGHVQQTT